jgi:predicted RND superfamily exporter protein
MIKRYISALTKCRKLLIILMGLTLIMAIAGIRQLQIEVEFDLFASDNSPYADTLNTLNESFSTNQLTVLLVYDQETFQVSDIMKAMSVLQVADRLESFEVSQMPMFSAEFMRLLGERSDITADAFVEMLAPLGPMSPVTLGEDKLYFRIDLPIKDKLSVSDLHQMEDHLNDQEITFHLAGDDYMQNKLFDYLLSILVFLPPLAIGGIFLVFSWQMGSIKATLLSVLPAIVASIWTMGIFGWSGSGVSITTVLAPIFTLIIGSADGLHFISHFQEAYETSHDKKLAVTKSLEMVGVPMIITTLTTMVGFLSLLYAREAVVNDLVIAASSGVFLAGIATWWFLPVILMSKLTLKPIKHRNERILLSLKRLWGKPIVLLLIVMIALTAVVLPSIRTDFNQLMFYKESTELYQSFEQIEKATGGGIPLMVAYEWSEGQSPLEISKVIETALMDNVYISRVIGIDQIAASLANISEAMQSQFLDMNSQIGRVIAFPNQLDDTSLKSIEADLSRLPLSNSVKITSVQYIMKDLNDQMVASQLPTQVVALLLVFILIFISLRKLIPSLVALVPITLTIYLLYGYLAITQIPLNLFSILMFSISIGIGIDYAIHFISVWGTFKSRNMSSEDAINEAFHYTSRPIIANAIGLAIGMSALMLSPLKIHTYVSMVMWFTMITSVILTLTLLPTILRKL